MKKLKILFLFCLICIFIWEINELVEIYNQYKIQKQQSEVEKAEVISDKKEVKLEIKKEIKEHYMSSKTWSKKYDKSGDRKERFNHIKETPVFKSKWTTWCGKKFIDSKKMYEITKIVLKRMPHIKLNEDVINLVVETCIAESNGGYYIKSLGGDYGVLQLRIETVNDMLKWLKHNHKDIYIATEQFKNPKLSIKDNLEQNIPYSIALCINEYWRKAGHNFTDHIGTIKERAIMWKSVYNTRKGLGTVNTYISRNENYEKTLIKMKNIVIS